MDYEYEPVGLFWRILALPLKLCWWVFKAVLPLIIVAVGVALVLSPMCNGY